MGASVIERKRLKRSDQIHKLVGRLSKGSFFLGQHISNLVSEDKDRCKILARVHQEFAAVESLYGVCACESFRFAIPKTPAPYPRLTIEFVYSRGCVLRKINLAFIKDPSDKRDDVAILEDEYCTQEGVGELTLDSIRIAPRFKDAYSQLTEFNKERISDAMNWYSDLCKEGNPPRFRVVDLPEQLSFEVETYGYWHRTIGSRV